MPNIQVNATVHCDTIAMFEDDAAQLQGIAPGTYPTKTEVVGLSSFVEFSDDASDLRQMAPMHAFQILTRSHPTPLTVRGDFLRYLPNGAASDGVLAIGRHDAPDQFVAAFAVSEILSIVEEPGC